MSSEPEPVRGIGSELKLHVILVQGRQRRPSPPLTGMTGPAEPCQPHQPRDPLPPDPDPEAPTQLGMHARRAVGAAGI